MPPGARRKAKKQDNLFAAVNAFLASQGKDTIENLDAATDRDYRSDDAVTIFAHNPPGFKPGVCKNCKRPYGTNRKSVGFCSDPCRREDWKKTTGLEWRAVSVHDVWDGDPPLVISPDQFEKLRQIAEWFNTNRTTLNTLIEKRSGAAPELEFLEEHLEETPDIPVDPQILVQALAEEATGFEADVSDYLEEESDQVRTTPESALDYEDPELDWLATSLAEFE
jgi:hypothetical protein